MKKLFQFLPLCFFALSPVASHAATNVVILSDDFQSKIDAAAPGDTLVVQAGVYAGNLNFTKPLTIVRSGTNQLQFTGATSISTTGAMVFSQVQFANTLSTQTNAAIALYQVTCVGAVTLNGGANLQAFDSQFPSLSATGGKAMFKRCSFSGALSVNNTIVEALRITNSSSVTATAPVGSGARLVIVQSSLHGYLNLSGYNAWIGYSSIIPTATFTDCDVVFIGNKVANLFNACGWGVYSLRGSLRAHNNLVDVQGQNNCGNRQFRGIVVDNATAEIANNTIHVGIGWVDNQGSGGFLIEAAGAAKISIRGCILYLNSNVPQAVSFFAGISGTAEQITEVSHCNIYMVDGNWSPAPPQFYGGVGGLNCIGADPVFTADGILLSGSPCIDAGPPNAIYNDRDGSRNDIGYTGGPLWNPANYTNSNPMVFWLMPTNQTVLKGLQSTIPINAAATAGH